MLMRVKNKIFNFKLFLKYSKKKNINIEKQLKIFELGDIDLNDDSYVTIKKGLIMKKNVSIRCRKNANLFIDENVYFNNNCVLTCREKITIGKNVSCGPNVIIFDHDHDYKSKNWRHEFITEEIFIGENTWIGGSAIILKGSNIGKNCVIAAGAVVSGIVPENSLYISKDKIKLIGGIDE